MPTVTRGFRFSPLAFPERPHLQNTPAQMPPPKAPPQRPTPTAPRNPHRAKGFPAAPPLRGRRLPRPNPPSSPPKALPKQFPLNGPPKSPPSPPPPLPLPKPPLQNAVPEFFCLIF